MIIVINQYHKFSGQIIISRVNKDKRDKEETK